MQIAPAGDRALLVDLGEVSAAELHAAAAAVRRVDSVVACIPGHSSLYVICEGEPDRAAIAAAAEERSAADVIAGTEHRIKVSFAGECAPDLEELLRRTGLTLSRFLAKVDGLRLTARHLGFRGGFAYLDGWPEDWSIPRRATPRPRVPAGSFAIAGGVAGFYPVDSPGGWNILGRTDALLEHAIAPGDVLVLHPTLEPVRAVTTAPPSRIELEYAEVLTAPLARIVGRPDWRRLDYGVPPGGPFDEFAAALANRAVGNDPDSPLLECAFSGPRLRFTRDATAAWCDPDLTVAVHSVRRGQELALGRIRGGMRGYLAVGGTARGGTAREEVRVTRGDRYVIHCLAGPHAIPLFNVECEVTPQLDRVGVRLNPRNLPSAPIPADLRSCGMQFGTVQLHPDGTLVAMGPDHPVTGGYLQPMTVLGGERWKLGQLLPGDRVRLVCSR